MSEIQCPTPESQEVWGGPGYLVLESSPCGSDVTQGKNSLSLRACLTSHSPAKVLSTQATPPPQHSGFRVLLVLLKPLCTPTPLAGLGRGRKEGVTFLGCLVGSHMEWLEMF